MDNSNKTMPSSQNQKDAIKIACLQFRNGVESSVPLRHFSQFHEETMIRSAAAMEKRNAVKKLMESIPNDCSDDRALVNELYSEMDKVIGEFLSTNAEDRNQTEAFLKKEIDFECEKFKMSLKAKLMINPELDLETIEQLLESGNLAVASYFDHHWNHGNVAFFQEQKRNLNEKLDHLGQEMLNAQKQNLEDLKAKKFLDEVKSIVLEMSKQIKCYVDALEGKVSKLILKERAQDIFDYLTGKGEVQNEKRRKVYLQLLGTIMHAMKFLGENEENMSAADLIGWTDKLDERLKFYCSENQIQSHNIDMRRDEHFPEMTSYEDLSKDASGNENDRGEMVIGSSIVNQNSISDAIEEQEIPIVSSNETYEGISISHSRSNLNSAKSSANGEGEENDVSNPVDLIQQNVNGQEMTRGTSVHTSNKPAPMDTDADVILEDDSQVARTNDNNSSVASEANKDIDESIGTQCEKLLRQAKQSSNSQANKRNSEENIVSNTNQGVKRARLVERDEVTNTTQGLKKSLTEENGCIPLDNGDVPISLSDNMQIDQPSTTDKKTVRRTRTSKRLNLVTKGKNERGDNDEASTAKGKNLGRQSSSKLPLRKKRPSKQLKVVNRSHLTNGNSKRLKGDFPLLRAIRHGNNFKTIKKMLDAGANVNVKRKVNGNNAAHEVIASIIEKGVAMKKAVAILNLLVNHRFNLLNDGDNDGVTPLHYSMEITDLDEELLTWFLENGANVNAVMKGNRDSVLLHAIAEGQNARILSKLVESGANPKQVNKWKQNALHRAFLYGNQEAAEIVIDKVDVNEGNIHNATPLHIVFENDELDHERCLRLLCANGANFEVQTFKGDIPFVLWLGYEDYVIDKQIIFSALMKTKDVLPITGDIASATLRYIMHIIESLQKYLPSSSQDSLNAFAQFIVFLIEEQGAKLSFRKDTKWNYADPKALEKIIKTYKNCDNIAEALWTTPIETVLVSLLNRKAYKCFVKMCRLMVPKWKQIRVRAAEHMAHNN